LITDSLFTNNVAMGASGGAAGAASGGFSFSADPGDAGGAFAGALYSEAAYIVLNKCAFVGNSAIGPNGLAGIAGAANREGSAGKSGGFAAGGAILNHGALFMTNCTFTFNKANAGNGGNGGAGAESPFGYAGGKGGAGGTASGGAVENNYQSRSINCTFSDNSAVAGTGGSGGAGTGLEPAGDAGENGLALGGALYNAANTFELGNTILEASAAGGNVAGVLVDLGGNLSSDQSYLFAAGSSHSGVSAGLLPLAANGGPTPTMAITTNSAAWNRGLSSLCPPTDQRGTNRAGLCDIGAYELFASGGGTGTNSSTNVVGVATNAVPLFLHSTGSNLVSLQWTARPNVVLEQSTYLVTNISVTNISTNFLVPLPGGLIITDIFATNVISTNWTPVTNPTTRLRGQNFVTLPRLTNQTIFFRLKGP
jgi:hypothetical protein